MHTEKTICLELEKISAYLPTAYEEMIQKAVLFDSLPSTNTYLLERARQNDRSIVLCLAESQTMGRGRFNRRWLSTSGHNICLSMLWTAFLDARQLSGLSLVVAVIVMRSLQKIGVHEGIGLKWPNDILWHGKKLIGILIDVHQVSSTCRDTVIGVGVNVMPSEEIKESIASPITDLFEVTGQRIDRNQLVAAMIESLFDGLAEFAERGLIAFIPEWLKQDVALNQKVKLLLDEQIIFGIYRGVDFSSGALLLEDAEGFVHRYLNGLVSLRLDNQSIESCF